MAKAARKPSGDRKPKPTQPPALEPFPRPLLRREAWQSLNGTWQFALDADASIGRVADVQFDQTIRVPYAPETPASGIGHTGFLRRCWYRRTFAIPPMSKNDRLLLHFEAVDDEATVWVNGQRAARHEGGYTPFCADITDLLNGEGEQEVVVRADDDPHDLAKPRGKQDWQPAAHGIWYPRTSGIWQTVWLEVVPSTHVAELRWTPNAEQGTVTLLATITAQAQAAPTGTRLQVALSFRGQTLVDDVLSVPANGLVQRTLPVAPPHAEDFAVDLLWSPDHPNLIDATLTLLAEDGQLVDRVEGYTALRSVRLDGDRFLLNRRETKLRLVLDQGYWPDTGLTPPDDAALRRDVELVKELGFNGVRKHQKIESRRFLYWADVLGLLVWEEMPSAYQFTSVAAQRISREWAAAIRRDVSHPCVGSSRVDLQACKLEYSIVSPK